MHIANKLALGGAALLGLAALVSYSGFIEGFVSGFEGHPGLPSCVSDLGRSGARSAIDNSPFAKSSSVTVIAITDPKSLSVSGKKVDCSGTAILNSGQRGIINYSFTNDPSLSSGAYLIQASLDLPSFKPSAGPNAEK